MDQPDDRIIAELYHLLERVLPRGAACAVESTKTADIGELFPEERSTITQAVPKRQREFAAGRIAARKALGQLGLPMQAIPTNGDRSPCWPPEIVGSITHSDELAVAAIAPRQVASGLGIDLERSNSVHADLWEKLFQPGEISMLAQLSSEAERLRWATVLFSAKESFFKLQHPLIGEWIDFVEAGITLDHESSAFEIRVANGSVSRRLGADTLRGRFGFAGQHTLTAISWPPRS